MTDKISLKIEPNGKRLMLSFLVALILIGLNTGISIYLHITEFSLSILIANLGDMALMMVMNIIILVMWAGFNLSEDLPTSFNQD